MSAISDTPARSITPLDERARSTGAALGDVFKSLKAISFYPGGHPLRNESLRIAHEALTGVMHGHELTLVITRAGFSAIEGGAVVENIPMTQALARELFLRRVQRLTLLQDVTLQDLRSFLSLLTIEPQKIANSGGLEQVMKQQGITTIWVNDIDLAEILAKRNAMEAGEELQPEADDETATVEETNTGVTDQLQQEAELSLEEIVALMEEEFEDNRFLELARLVASKGEELKRGGDFAPLLLAMDALVRHTTMAHRSVTQREYAGFTLEQLAAGGTTDHLLSKLQEPASSEHELLFRIIKQLGEKMVYPLIHRLCIAEELMARKALASALVRIGSTAVPPLVSMLQDDRWYVVRNMVAILGEIGGRDCVGSLRSPLNHIDERVRKETIRTLVKIGGPEAEAVIIGLLGEKGAGLVRQAILSLGLMKSQLAVSPLLGIINERDLFLASLPLKKEAVQALGRIGDKRATPHLVDIIESRKWVAWSRWEDLKVAAATSLGQLGDEAALPVLRARASHNSQLGKACSEAVDTIERLAAEIYE